MTFHITSRGVRREPLFSDRLDYLRFLEILDRAVTRFEWSCLAYCLMTNHVHLVVRLKRESLSDGMHLVNGGYARRFNERYGFTGHVFERRFAAEHIQRQTYLLEVLRYVPLNPVRAGLCSDPADWEWSSFRASAGLRRPVPSLATRDVQALFGTGPARNRGVRYAAFVRDGLDSLGDDSPRT